MRYLDKVNYIQRAHNSGKTHGGTGHSYGSIQPSCIASAFVCCMVMKYGALQ